MEAERCPMMERDLPLNIGSGAELGVLPPGAAAEMEEGRLAAVREWSPSGNQGLCSRFLQNRRGRSDRKVIGY